MGYSSSAEGCTRSRVRRNRGLLLKAGDEEGMTCWGVKQKIEAKEVWAVEIVMWSEYNGGGKE